MATDPQLQQLLAQYGLDTGTQNDPEEQIRRLYADLGIPYPEKKDEGLDIFQPVRTFFGAAGNVGGQVLGLADPEAYQRAQEEVRGTLGYDEKSPWYEKAEALPGLGDVAAEMVPEDIRNSAVGRAIGPFGRVIGNILGDPTTYSPFVLKHLGGLIARSVPAAAPLIKEAALARQAREIEVAAGNLTRALALEKDAEDAAKIYRVVKSEGTALQRIGYDTSQALAHGGDLAMGSAAALAYGPQVVQAAWEGAKRIPEADSPGEAVIEGVNTALMAGLSILMGKGLIDAATAARTLAVDAHGRSLEATRKQVNDAVTLGENRVLETAQELTGEPGIPEVSLTGDLGAEEVGGPLHDRMTRLRERIAAEQPSREPVAQPRAEQAGLPPSGRLRPEDLESLDLEAARARLEGRIPPPEEPPAPTPVRKPEPPPAPEGEGGAAVEVPTPEVPTERVALEPVLQPYADLLRGGDLREHLAERGWTPEEFKDLPHSEKLRVLLEAQPGERFPGEPIEPKVTAETPPPEPAPEAVEAPQTPPEVTPKVEAPPEPTAPVTEPAAEPSTQRAESKESIQEPSESRGPETTPPQSALDKQLARTSDEFSKEGTIQKAARSIIEGRKSRGETAPKDPLVAAELSLVLDDDVARRKLLNATFETGEVRDGKKVKAKLADLPPNKVHPAIVNWIKANRLKTGGAGQGARGAAGSVERATTSVVGQEGKGKKALKREAAPGAYEAANEILKRAGLRYRQFAEAVADQFEGAQRLPHNKEMFSEYIGMRERGVSRSQAIEELAQKRYENPTPTKSQTQAIRNLVASYEKKLNEEAMARHGADVRKAAEEAGTLEAPADAPDARPAKVPDIAGLHSRWSKLKAQIPTKPDGMSPEEFAGVLKQKRGDLQKMLEDYYRFTDDRAQMQGLGRKMPDTEMKSLAKGLGIKVSKGVNIHWLIRKIGEKLDISDTHWSPLLDQHRVGRAAKVEAAATRQGQFEVPGWKSKGGGKERNQRSAVQWESPNGTKVTVTDEGKNIVLDEIRSPAEAKLDILEALQNGGVERVIFPESIKGLGPILDELPLVYDDAWADAHPEANVAHYKVDRSDATVHPYEYRDLANPYNPYEGAPIPIGMVNRQLENELIEDTLRGGDPEILKGINRQLTEAKGTGNATGVGEELGSGMYHRVFRLDGAKDAEGRNVVLRAGYMPWTPMVTAEQKALLPPVYGHGKLTDGTRYPVYYTLHPEGFRVQTDIPVELALDAKGRLYDWARKLGLTWESGKGKSRYFVQGMHDAINARMLMENSLPPGISMQDWFDDIAELFTRAEQADMHIVDMGDIRQGLRPDQTVYMPLKGTAPENTVVRETPDGAKWALYFSDAGVVRPNDFSSLGTAWEGMPYQHAIAQMAAEGIAERRLTLGETHRRAVHYREDDLHGIDLGDDLKVVNHDRRADDDFVRRLSEIGSPLASALKKVTNDVVSAINRELEYIGSNDLFKVKLRGLTASPYLNGVYVRDLGEFGAGIYVNPVTSVRRAASHAEAVDDILFSLFHEITHDKATGHGDTFRDVGDYIKGLREIEANFDQYRKTISDAFTESHYRAMRDELLPGFNEMRERYGRRSWGEEALQRLSTRDAEGSVAGRADRRGGGAEAPPGGGARRVQPGRTLPRGGGVEAGQLRSPAAARGSAAEGRAPGEGAGYGSGRGAYDATVGRVEEFLSNDRKLDAEKAKALLDDLVTRKKDLHPREIHNHAWDMATRVVNQMTDDQVRETIARKPHGKGVPDAVFNLTHFPDLSDRFRARMQIWGDLTAGHRKRDRIRHWEEVEREVQGMLALDTPESWALAFRKKGGGLRDSEVLLLREIHNELAGRVFDAESRFTQAIASGDRAAVDREWKNLNNARGSYFGVANKAADLLTEQARAMAIAGMDIRRQSPHLAFEQDLLAGLREKTRKRFSDPAEAERVARKLRDEFMSAKDAAQMDPNSWADFYKAYRTMMGSKLFPDKIIEFYKAGLLGYSSRVANIGSNGLFRAVRFVEDGVAAGLDAVASKLTGKERDMFLGEAGVSVLAMRRAFAEGFPDWLKANWDAFRLRPEDGSRALTQGGILEDLLQHPGAIEGKFGEFVRFAFKGLSADDQLAKQISATDHMYRTIYRRLRKGELAANVGESLVQATERIFSDMRSNYEDALRGLPFDSTKFSYFEKIFKDANEVARGDTFQKELGNMGRGVQSVLTNHPMLQVFIPFLRTPSNIAKETIKRTPLGLIEVAAKWKDLDNVGRLQALSRPLTGTAIGLGVMSLAMDGSITGGGPVDPEDREALIASGWQPYSVKVGNQWVSFQRFEPIAAIFGIAADAAEGMRHGDFDQWNTGAMRVMQSAAENITNKTFLAGLDGVTSAISHPNLFLGRFEKQMQGSMIPNSLGFIPVGHLARAIDPIYRDAEPLSMDVWTRKIPWLSTTVEPQYGPTGEERRRGGSAIERLVSPFSRWPMREGPEALGAEEIVRLGVAPSPPRKYMYSKGGVKVQLTPEERKNFAKAMQEATKVIGQRVLKDPNYLKLPDDENDPRWKYGQKTKKDVLQRLFTKYRSRVRSAVQRDVERRGVQQYRERKREQSLGEQLGIG